MVDVLHTYSTHTAVAVDFVSKWRVSGEIITWLQEEEAGWRTRSMDSVFSPGGDMGACIYRLVG